MGGMNQEKQTDTSAESEEEQRSKSARGADLVVKIAGFVGLACEKTVSDTAG